MKHAHRINVGRRLRLGSASALAALTMAGGAALAQTEPAAPPPPPPPVAAPPAGVQEVIVTGSRISDSDAASANPISLVSAADLNKSKATTLEDYFRKTPAVDFSGGVTSASNDVALGASFAGLRNLGPQRTLVLVNGQRYPLTNVGIAFDAVDLNNIPLPMIERIDILRDGASSVYGADAVGGVINVITKNHFNGVEIGGGVGESGQGDALKYSVYSIMGSDFDKGNVLIEVGTDHNDGLPSIDREWASTDHPNAGFNSWTHLSSHVIGMTATIAGKKWFFPSGLDSGIRTSQAYTLGAVDAGGGYVSGGALPPGDLAALGGSVDYEPLPYQGVYGALDRRQINLTGNYEITPDITATVEGFYTNRSSHEFLAPVYLGSNATPAFPSGLDSAGYPEGGPAGACNQYNPTCSSNSVTQLALDNKYGIDAARCAAAGHPYPCAIDVPINTRRAEAGDRQFLDDLDTYRMRAALDGTIFNDYTWETGYFYGQSSAVDRTQNAVNLYHASQELGMNSCGTEIGCSLANFFGYNTLTPAQSNYMTYTATDTSQYTMSEAYGNIGGPIWELPAGKIKGVVGFEYRTDSLYDNPDPVTAAGDTLIFSSPTNGAYATASGYIEVNAPLLKDLPFVKMLTLDASGRYDYNTVFGKALTDKIGLDWAVTDDFRFRGAHTTGFRAPQVEELYGGHFLQRPGGTDPCAPGGTDYQTPTCEAALAAVNGSDATVNQVFQLDEVSGGNPQLKPETSQEWTMGGVFTPTFVPGLSMTVDYYTVLVRDEISTLDPNAILAACYGNVPYVLSQAAACGFVGPRQQNSGNLGPINGLNGNVYDENTDGIDMHVSYTTPTEAVGLPAWGSLTFNGDANYLLSDNVSSNGVTVQQAGSFFNDTGWPRWKALANLTFAQDNWSVGWTTRYYGGIHNQDGTSACEYGSVTCPATGALDFQGNETAGVFYHDISGTLTYQNVNLTIGVDNLLDKDPPYLTPTGGPNSISAGGYDEVGRFIYMKASIKF